MSNLMRNIYDFDGTIYDGDSTIDFFFYCISQNKRVLYDLPFFALALLKYKLKIIDKIVLKEAFYSFLKRMKLTDDDLNDFWSTHINKIKPWYIAKKNSTDIIISASPEFLLMPVVKLLSIEVVIASKVDILRGKCLGPNCRGEEKVNRLKSKYPEIKVMEFYSDNISDEPLAKIAEKSYFVKKNKITKWNFN